MIITKTPYRVSLFGGGTDFRDFYSNHSEGGSVIGFSLSKYCWITLRRLPPYFRYKHRVVYSQVEIVQTIAEIKHPCIRAILRDASGEEEGFEIHHDGDIPANAGIGSSSSFTVGLINAVAALRGQRLSSRALASMAIEIERNRLQEPGGDQDQIWAAYGGGLSMINFIADEFNYNRLQISPARTRDILDHLLLVFTGFQRQASSIEANKIQRIGVNETALGDIRHTVEVAEHIMRKGNIEDLGPLLNETWEKKRTLAPDVSNGNIDSLYDSALRAGATGGKILGAGGGGFMLLFVPPKQKAPVREALRGLIEVPVGIATRGSEVVVYEPEGL